LADDEPAMERPTGTHKFMFVSLNNLRIGDVERLLEEYKRLVIENERLKLILTTNNIDHASALNESGATNEEQEAIPPSRRKRTNSHRRTQSSV